MKKLLLILLCLPMIGFGQQTYVPDDNFEQALINLGYDNVMDDSVLTANINTVTLLDISYQNVSDLTGIEDFISLTYLDCSAGQLTTLDVSNNIALTMLACEFNQLTSLDVSNNIALTMLACSFNQLTSLDVRNGYNTNLSYFAAYDNTNLFCIDVDDVVWSTVNWTSIDPQHYYSTNCSSITFDCTDSLEVMNVIIENTNLTMNIAIYNGYNSFLNYPYVAFTIDANSDTIQSGNINLFGAINLDTTWYNYSISNAIFPAYPLTMYFVYSDGSLVTDTCILIYNSTSTDISDFHARGKRKIIRIVDVLGRETKQTNQPFFYIYDDGTVEKRIVIE